MAYTDELQVAVNHYRKSLIVPSKLFELNQKTGSGPSRALVPAIVLTVIGAFEAFVENFICAALLADGVMLGQVADAVGRLNNPTPRVFQKLATSHFHALQPLPTDGFTLELLRVPIAGKPGENLWLPEVVDWEQCLLDADGWMQARHALSHGAVSGWSTEAWPKSVVSKTPAGKRRAILKTGRTGQTSITLQGARNCARIFDASAKHVSNVVAVHLGFQLSWHDWPQLD